MKTISPSIFQKTLIPFALLDTDLTFFDVSDQWLKDFDHTRAIKGMSFYKVMPHLPPQFKLDVESCLSGVSHKSNSKRVVMPGGRSIWYDWKISSVRAEDNSVNGVMVILEDITSKKLEEELLIKSQEVACIGGWEVDLVHNTVYWTKLTHDILEVPYDYQPTLEKGISFYKEGFSRDTITRLVQEGMEHGRSWDTELQIITPKGREKWVRVIGEPEMLDGKCIRLMGTFQDYDKQKKVSNAYKKVTERLALATKAAMIGIWEYDILKNEIFWDQNMHRIYGIPDGEFAGSYDSWKDCLLPEDVERASNEIIDAIYGKKDFNTIFRILWPNGEVRYINAEAAVVRDSNGRPLKMVGVNQDITVLKTTQMQLVKSEESLQGAFKNSSMGMALVGLDGKFIEVNQSLCTSLGYSNEELLQKTFQDLTHPDDLEIDLTLLQDVIAGKRTTYQMEKRYFDKLGQIVHVLLTVTAVKKIDGTLSHFISQIMDISSRIRAEHKLKGLLEVTTNQNNSLVNFAHIVSHNLRSHAANLSMISGFLMDETLSEDEHAATLEMLGKASSRLNETIQHLNEVVQVKLETDKELDLIPLRTAVDKVLMDVGALLTENEVQVQIDIAPSLLVKGVHAYVDSILLNFVTNAIKYRDPQKESLLSITAMAKDDHVIINLEDNGLGIDLEKHGEKLFGMYKTFHGNQDAKGIGLFITKNQIESMGGSISVYSQMGKGTTFQVKLLR